jgi:prepilin-type processing-associated H-X9-DG protein
MNRLTSRHRGATQADLVVGLVLCAVLSAGMIAADGVAAERARRVKCASNLRQIGQGIMLYANENKGAFPRTLFDKDSGKAVAFTNPKVDKPFGERAPGPNDVTAALFLILRTQDLTSEVFICPSTDDEKPGADPQQLSNFPHPKNVSYSYANPYVGKDARTKGLKLNFTLGSDYAIVSDMNPGGAALGKAKGPDMRGDDRVEGAGEGMRKVPEAWKGVNSPNHGLWGQNVLYADGHVEWATTPFCGMPREDGQRDNIYTRHLGDDAGEDIDRFMGTAMDQFDSVLLPTIEGAKKKVKSKAPDEESAPKPNANADPKASEGL